MTATSPARRQDPIMFVRRSGEASGRQTSQLVRLGTDGHVDVAWVAGMA